MTRLLALLFSGCACLAACATTDTTTSTPAPVMLSDAQFQPLRKEVFASDDYDVWEEKAQALLARNDLTQPQRAEVYYGRAVMRGVYVRDGKYAFPKCATKDFEKFLSLAPEGHALIGKAHENIAYQVSRYHHFADASPAECD